MQDLTPALLPRLENHRLDGLDAGPGVIYPYYAGCSVANLPASICHWLGLPGLGAQPFIPEILELYPRTFRHVILLVIDGLGLNMLKDTLRQATADPRFTVWSELAEEAALVPLTSLSPSTTSAVLTTFWTASTPGEHGVVGYEVWLKEYGLIANMILHSPASFQGDPGSLRRAGFRPDTFLPVPTLGPHLQRHGVRPYAFQHAAIARSGLSEMLLPGVEVFPFRSLSDLWVTLAGLLESRAEERNYSYLYWGDLDEHSHRFGPGDERVSLEWEGFSRQLGHFIRRYKPRARQDTLLIITADHGHISTPRRPEYELRRHPELTRCLAMLPSGEARLPFVFLRVGREESFLRYVEETWPGQFRVFPSAQVIASGLFGDRGSYERLTDRVGDYVVIPQDGAYWWFGGHDNPLLGRHGGLSRTEMLVPLFMVVL